MAVRLASALCLLALCLQGETRPRLLRRVEPAYPPLAKTMRIQGTVRLAVAIDEEGAVAAIKLISGHPLLVRAAIDAVKQWRYRPAEQNGRPVRSLLAVSLTFRLSNGPPEQTTRV